jgi:hypothetical protein
MLASLYDPRLATPPLGAIIATCRLVACEHTDAVLARGISSMEEAFGNYGPGRYAWRLEDIEPLPEPVPYRGAQGFFDVPDDVLGPSPRAVQQGSLL